MTELLLIIVYLLFLGLSFLVRRLMIKVKLGYIVLLVPIYYVSTYGIFQLIYDYNQYLKRRYLPYFDFGHASTGLVMLFIVCMITAVVIVGSVIIARNRLGRLS